MKKITLLLALLTLLLQANAQLSPLSFYDNFAEDSKIVWPHMATGNEMYYKESGRYIVEYKQGERGWSVNSNFPKVQWDGLSIEVTVNVLEGNSPGIGTGLLIGNSSTPGISYRFVIQTDGTYGFGYLKDNAVKWIVPFTASKNIVKGNNVDNKLKVKITNNKAQLYINYVLENTAILPEPITGEQIALYSGKGQRAAFDNLRIDGFSLITDPPGKIEEMFGEGYKRLTVEIKKYNTLQSFADFLNDEFKNNFPHFRSRMAQKQMWYYQPIFIKDQNNLGIKNAQIKINIQLDQYNCVQKGELEGIDIYFFFKTSQEASNFVSSLTKCINQNSAADRLINMADIIKPKNTEYNYAFGNRETGLIENALKIDYFENKAADYMGWGEFTKGVSFSLKSIGRIIKTYAAANPNDYNTDFAKDFRRLFEIGERAENTEGYNLDPFIKNKNQYKIIEPYWIYESNLAPESLGPVFIYKNYSFANSREPLLKLLGILNTYKNQRDSTQSEKEFNSFFEKISLTLGNKYYSSEDRRDCTKNNFDNKNTLSDFLNSKSNKRHGPKEKTIYFYSRKDQKAPIVELRYRENLGENNKFESYSIYCFLILDKPI